MSCRAVPRRLLMAMVFAVVIVALVPSVALGVGRLQGAVLRDGSFAPIQGARVSLYEQMPGGFTYRWELGHRTGAAGLFIDLDATGAGLDTYLVRIRRPGYVTTDTVPFLINSDPTARLFNMRPDPVLTERAWGADRYSTAVNIAREHFTSPANPQGWWDVETIVIASGEDRAAADPLTAAGLCGTYDGDTPLFLVSSTTVPSSVKQALREISMSQADVRVIVVGGPVSVPDARLAEIKAAMPNGANVDRLIDAGDRYDLAAAIAERMASVRGRAGTALVANGADPDKFFDALALSTLAASRGLPILLVNENSIPPETLGQLDQLPAPRRRVIIGGGPATVSNGVMTQLDQRYDVVERWAGPDRYWTAIAIADKAVAMLPPSPPDDDLVGVVSTLPDALTGGATIGQAGGVLLLTNGKNLTPSTGNWLAGHKAEIDKCYVVGGPASVMPGVLNAVDSRLQ